jgi:hypothetical protein
MTTHEDPNDPRRDDPDDPTVPAVERERGGVTDASLDPEADTDVDTPDPSLTDDAAEVEAHPS